MFVNTVFGRSVPHSLGRLYNILSVKKEYTIKSKIFLKVEDFLSYVHLTNIDKEDNSIV